MSNTNLFLSSVSSRSMNRCDDFARTGGSARCDDIAVFFFSRIYRGSEARTYLCAACAALRNLR